METLLPQLQAAGVGQVWLEARNDRLNQNDRAMVEAMRGQRLLRTEFRVDVARPLDEPMLWVSDVVAGAVKARWDGRPDWFGVMQHRVPEYLIALR